MTWVQSVLEPAGPQAAAIEGLWWLFFWICAGVYTLVLAALALALVRRRRPGAPPEATSARAERRAVHVVATATGVTVVLLVVLLTSSVLVGRRLEAPTVPPAVTIVVTGQQWWWDIEYEADAPTGRVRTANEMHVPAGEPVRLKLRSRDVIHSFWVPALHGKKDLVPGRETTTWIQADRPGIYRGQCAEFCGHDPQRIKAGNRMPNLGLPAPDLQALVAYLRSLE